MLSVNFKARNLEVFQWKGDRKKAVEFFDCIGGEYGDVWDGGDEDDPTLVVKIAAVGWMDVAIGDWIIHDPIFGYAIYSDEVFCASFTHPVERRIIETFKIPDVSDSLELVAIGERDVANANYQYEITGFSTGSNASGEKSDLVNKLTLLFQKGPIPANGVNGITSEVLLSIVKDRLESFQKGPYPCFENQVALNYVTLALSSLQRRTMDRRSRSVEGKNTV